MDTRLHQNVPHILNSEICDQLSGISCVTLRRRTFTLAINFNEPHPLFTNIIHSAPFANSDLSSEVMAGKHVVFRIWHWIVLDINLLGLFSACLKTTECICMWLAGLHVVSNFIISCRITRWDSSCQWEVHGCIQ